MAALQRHFPLGGIILGNVHRPEGPVVGFSGGCRVPCAGLRGNDDGVQRWWDCCRILLVDSSFGVFDSSSSLTSLHMKSKLQPRGLVATMTGEGQSQREDFRRCWSCTSSPRSSYSESELSVLFVMSRLFGMGRRGLREAVAVRTSFGCS
jgi:hypothetical protein